MSTPIKKPNFDLSWSKIKQIAQDFALATGMDTDAFASFEQALSNVESGITLADLKGFTDKELGALHAAAHHFYTHGAYDDAQSIYNLLIRLDHFEAKYYLGLAACKQMGKDHRGALILYEAAFLLDSRNPKMPFNSAVCYLALDQLDLAKQALAHANRLLVHPLKQADQSLYARVLKLESVVAQRERRARASNKQKDAV